MSLTAKITAAILRLKGPGLHFRRSITGTLVLIVSALAVPLVVIPIAALRLVADTHQTAQRNALFYAARSIAAGIDAEIDTYVALANSLVASPSLLSDDLAAFEVEARRVTVQYPAVWVLISDLGGQQLLNTALRSQQSLPLRSAAGLAVQARALASGRPEVSDVLLSPARGVWVATVDIAVPKNGAPWRVLSIVTTLEGFSALLSRQSLPAGWLVGIIDRAGNFIARAPRAGDMVGRPASAGFRGSRGQEGVREYPSLEGDVVVSANGVSLKSGWTVAVAIPKAEIASGSLAALLWTGSLSIAIVMMSFLGAFLLARRITREISDFRDQTAALVQGQPAKLKSTVPEIAETWTVLATAVHAREAAEAARSEAAKDRAQMNKAFNESEARLQLALNAANLGLWEYNVLDGTVSWDTRFKELFDVGNEAAHLDVIVQRLLPDDVQPVKAALAAACAIVNPVPYFIQYRIRRSDGSIRWIEAHGTADFEGADDQRKVARVVGTVADITATKQQEEQTQLLMREVAHRSKNILSVVQSVARLTARTGHVDFAARFADRIHALAASQDVIVNGNWQSVNLIDLVRSQLAHFRDLIGSRIVLDGAALHISPAAAQTLGMALHELATNASKYGALANDNGRILIRWRVSPEIEGDRFEISWVESDGPIVEPPSRRGFGTTVIETMAKSGLSAVVSLDYPATGLVWQLSCPAARVRDNH
jgi:PAS domain S-box-containing protein